MSSNSEDAFLAAHITLVYGIGREMIPCPAQDRPIHHRLRFFLSPACSHRADNAETIGQLRIRRENGDHAMFLSPLQDPPHGIDRADAGCGSQVGCLRLDGVTIKLNDDARGLSDARCVRRWSIRQVHHGASARSRGGHARAQRRPRRTVRLNEGRQIAQLRFPSR